MKRLRWIFPLILGLLSGCGTKQVSPQEKLTSIQIVDRNGFKETISSLDRLKQFEETDFFLAQPYEKVLRMYGRNPQGKTISKLTTYHENGQPWRFLEVMNGRACGTYREWHDNGILRLSATVVEGLGDLTEEAQRGWIFDGLSRVWDKEENMIAEICYEKGKLQGNAIYYHPNGKIKKLIPYENDHIDGELLYYDHDGKVIGKAPFVRGKRDGISFFKGDKDQPAYSEDCRDDLLIHAIYHDFSGKIVGKIENGKGMQAIFLDRALHSMQEYKNGIPEGEVQLFDKYGKLLSFYYVKDGMKCGEEWIYYPSFDDKKPQPKLYLQWHEDSLHGICRSWYPNGALESEREIMDNKKQGFSSAWYKDGSLMLIEEYENDQLYKGSYMKKGESRPVSTVENGEGIATIHDGDGFFLRRAIYDKGRPINEL